MLESDLLEQFYTGVAAGRSIRELRDLMRDTAVRLVESRQVPRTEMRRALQTLPEHGLESDRTLLSGIVRMTIEAVDRLSYPEPLVRNSPETRTATPLPATTGSPSLQDPIQQLATQLYGLGMSEPDLRALVGVLQQQTHNPAFFRSIRALVNAAGPFPDAC